MKIYFFEDWFCVKICFSLIFLFLAFKNYWTFFTLDLSKYLPEEILTVEKKKNEHHRKINTLIAPLRIQNVCQYHIRS